MVKRSSHPASILMQILKVSKDQRETLESRGVAVQLATSEIRVRVETLAPKALEDSWVMLALEASKGSPARRY